MSDLFLEFLRSYTNVGKSVYFLDELIRDSYPEIQCRGREIVSVAAGIHDLFKHSCMEIVELRNVVELPDHIKEDKREEIGRQLLNGVTRLVESGTSIQSYSELSYHGVAERMIEEVFHPMVDLSSQIEIQLDAGTLNNRGTGSRPKL